MISVLFKLFMIFNSLAFAFVVFLINWEDNFLLLNNIHVFFKDASLYISYLLYIGVVVALSWLSLLLAKGLTSDCIEVGSVSSIEISNSTYLPVYLGYFFIALSVQNLATFICVFIIIYAFTIFSQINYFNPIYLFLGYRFYHVTNADGAKVMLITKSQYKKPKTIQIKDIKRINDFTFIEIKRGK